MTKEFYILLSLLLFTGFGTAAVIFFHDDDKNRDPMYQLQQDVCLKLRKNAIRYFLRHEPFEAEAEVRRLLKLDPDNREMLLFFGRILFETGRSRESEDVFRKLIALSPLDKGARNNLAVVMASRHQYEAARREFSAIAGDDSIASVAAVNLDVVKKALELTAEKRNFALTPETGKLNFRYIGAITVKIIELPPENKSK